MELKLDNLRALVAQSASHMETSSAFLKTLHITLETMIAEKLGKITPPATKELY